jgi:hypothetical protein
VLTKKQIKLEYGAAADYAAACAIDVTQYKDEEVVKWHRKYLIAAKQQQGAGGTVPAAAAAAVPARKTTEAFSNSGARAQPTGAFEKDEFCQAQWEGLWYHCSITKCNPDGSYAIHFPATNGFLDRANPALMRRTAFFAGEHISCKWSGKWLPAVLEATNADGSLRVLFTQTSGVIEKMPRVNVRKADLTVTTPL